MRYILLAWATPLLLFWGWYFLSINDINFGYPILSRPFNLAIFALYGELLKVDPAMIPWMIAKACAFDTLLLSAIWAYRRRKTIAAKFRERRARYLAAESAPSV